MCDINKNFQRPMQSLVAQLLIVKEEFADKETNTHMRTSFCFIVRNLQLKLYVYLYEDMSSRGGEWGYFGLPETPTRAI